MPRLVPAPISCLTLAWPILALLSVAVALPAIARASEAQIRERPFIVAVTVGARMFPQELELNDDFSFGGRVGLGFGSRWALLLDFVASHPHRETTSVAAYVDALRLLARMNLHTGRFRPYILAGLGGVLFIFNDTPSTAGGALTAGLGADLRIAPQTTLFLEGSTDFYSQQEITYQLDGSVSFAGPEEAKTLGNISLGIGVEF